MGGGYYHILYRGTDKLLHPLAIPVDDVNDAQAESFGYDVLPGNVLAPTRFTPESARRLYDSMQWIRTTMNSQIDGAIAGLEGFGTVLEFTGAYDAAGTVFKRVAGRGTVMAAASQGPKCLAAGTLVSTANGRKAIEDVKVGEMVWSRDEVTGVVELRPVAATMTSTGEVFELLIEQESAPLLVTREHPFWTPKGWISAGSLAAGDHVLVEDGDWTRVVSIAAIAGERDVYNLEVSEFYTYFVGDTGVWVHNTLCLVAKARALIAKMPSKYFIKYQCQPCAKAMIRTLKKNGISGELLTIKSNNGFEHMVSSLVENGTNTITNSGMHYAIRAGDTVFDNSLKEGVDYEMYVKSFAAPEGVTVTATPF